MRPERVHHLFAVEAVVWSQRQKLDQSRRVLEPPLVLPDGPRPHSDRETAEHPYPNSLWFVIYHRRLPLAAMITMVTNRHYLNLHRAPLLRCLRV